MFRQPLARNIEGGPVIYGRAYEWQAKGDVDGLAKRQAFDGDHRLIMVTRNDPVKLAARGAQEDRGGGKATGDVHVLHTATGFDRRNDLRSLLDAEESSFSPVRVQGGDRQTRAFDPPALQLSVRKMDHTQEPVALDQPDRFRERHVRGKQYDAQVRCD